jgi:hypothetical protein
MMVLTGFVAFMVWLEHWAGADFKLKKYIQTVLAPKAPIAFGGLVFITTVWTYLRPFSLFPFFIAVLAIIAGILSLYREEVKVVVVKKTAALKGWQPFLLTIFLGMLMALFLAVSTICFVDTDAGRLLFDARLITEGLVPFRDFVARAPIFIYFLSLVYPLFSTNLHAYYLLSAFLVWLTVIGVYFIAENYYGRMKALGISALYLLVPVIWNILYLKTQTGELLFVTISILTFILAQSAEAKKKNILTIASHILMLIALFIRPTAVIFYSVHLVIALYRQVKIVARLIRDAFITGVVFFVATILFFKTNHGLFYTGSLWPFGPDLNSLRLLFLIPAYVSWPVLIISTTIVLGVLIFRRLQSAEFLVSMAVLTVCLTLAYTVNLCLLGFWPQYAMEYMLPLAVLTIYGVDLVSKALAYQYKKDHDLF